MKKINILFLSLGLLVLVASSFQAANQGGVVAETGNLKFLKGQQAVLIDYSYEGMGVGKYKTEDEYTKEKVTEYNKKEAGKGDKWLEGWVSARKNRYQPKFEELINDVLAGQKMNFKESNTSAKYKLLVKTTFTEPGFNVGVMSRPASANFDFIFVEVANPDKVVAKYYVNNVPGAQAMGMDFDAGSRIAEAYAKAGKMLGKQIAKETK